MLFFWEEEAMWWRLLEQERVEIATAMKTASQEAKQELKIRLESVNMRKQMRPSRRPVETGGYGNANTQQPQAEGPPQYS